MELWIPDFSGGSAMLVLSRKVNETIVINDDIFVTVVRISGDQVKLGIEAPKEVPVHRKEVFDRYHSVEAENSRHDDGQLPETD